MKQDIAEKLLQVNRQFYQTFALQFSETRGRIQPGVHKILDRLPLTAVILDAGCGNGELAVKLDELGLSGRYVGVDFSEELISIARQQIAGLQGVESEKYEFIQANLAKPGWDERFRAESFDVILSFAVLHHLPGDLIRKSFLYSIRRLLAVGGEFMLSTWQFKNSERLSERVQPWESAGISENDVDPGDYLLDWRHGGQGLRYVHLFGEDELVSLAQSTGFMVKDSFLSDGEGGRLGLYQVWVK